jgi:hypothetical protein
MREDSFWKQTVPAARSPDPRHSNVCCPYSWPRGAGLLTVLTPMIGGCKGGDAGFPQMLRAAAVNISLRSKHAHTSYKAVPESGVRSPESNNSGWDGSDI